MDAFRNRKRFGVMRKRKKSFVAKRNLPLLDERQRYTVPEASALLRQSVAKTYVDISRGALSVIKDGARTYIPGTEIVRRSRYGSVAQERRDLAASQSIA
jgi:predicted ribosome-associated RNA-binding protein Tma20